MPKEGLTIAPLNGEYDPNEKGIYGKLIRRLEKGAVLHVRFELLEDGSLNRSDDFKTLLSEIAIRSIWERLPLDIIITAPGPDQTESKHITLTLHRRSEYQ